MTLEYIKSVVIDSTRRKDITSEMEQKVLAFIRKHHMLLPNDSVLVGVSGGADSVCLLVFLNKVQSLLGIHLFVVHVNHQFRGEQAKKDELFVEKLCKQLDAPFAAVSVSMEQKAREEKMTLEEAGRAIRYEIFERKAEEWHCNKIAVAHHQDDQAETMLFQMFRGSGLTGISGMQPMRGKIIRPFLCIERNEIEHYLKMQGISYCIDSTNFSNEYSRNKIRNQLIPFLKEQINKGTVRHLLQLSEVAGEADLFIEKEAKKRFSLYTSEKEGNLHLSELAWQEDKIVTEYIIRLCVQKMTGFHKDITFTHIYDIYQLQERSAGKQLCLPNDLRVQKEAEGLLFYFTENYKTQTDKIEQKERLIEIQKDLLERKNGIFEFEQSGRWFSFRLRPHKKNENFPKKLYTKCFDYDKIKNIFFLRTREPGDFLVINHEGKRKKLKKYLIDEKIDCSQRDKLLLLANGSDIIWVIGHRMSEFYKVTEQTNLVLEVTVTEENNDRSD